MSPQPAKSLTETETRSKEDYYVWAPPGTGIEAHIHLEVVDLIQAEVMRGFGILRQRNEEVGGLLIGTITPGSPTVIQVDDFEMVPCDYRNGPAYILNGDEKAAFKNARERLRESDSSKQYAVGYFRSDTRGPVCLTGDDIELMDDCFPETGCLALIVKPSRTQPICAGFFPREYGILQTETPLEFPFSWRELTTKESPPRRRAPERRRASEPDDEVLSIPERKSSAAGDTRKHKEEAPSDEDEPLPPSLALEKAHMNEVALTSNANPPAYPKTMRMGWVVAPLSLAFLLMGVILGYQAALNVGAPAVTAPRDNSLSLSATKSGENLSVQWNTAASVLKMAEIGELTIEDRGFTKIVPLDRAILRNGTIIVRNASPSVRFRLTVYSPGRAAATETLDWNE